MNDTTVGTVQVPGSYVYVEQGGQGGTMWGVASAASFTIGTTPINWTQIGGGGGGVTLDTLATDIAASGTQAAGGTGKAADAGHVHGAAGTWSPADYGWQA